MLQARRTSSRNGLRFGEIMTRRWQNMMNFVRYAVSICTLQHFSISQDMDSWFKTFYLANNLKSFKGRFETMATTVRFVSTNGLRLFLQFWYSKRPIFWIPQGWAPAYVQWLLSFPRAPTGSVSIQIWGIACASVISLFGSAVVASLLLVQGRSREGKKERVEADGKEEKGKKEL